MRRKNEVFTHFQTLVAMIQNIFHNTIKFLQSDNGTEYVNNAFFHYCKSLGIQQRFSCPHTHNRMALLRANIVILPQWLAISFSPLVPHIIIGSKLFWHLFISSIFFPHPLLIGIQHILVSMVLRLFIPLFVSLVVLVFLGPYVSNKLFSPSIECVFIGYSPHHKGYRCLDPSSGRVYVSRHVLFNVTQFPYKNL